MKLLIGMLSYNRIEFTRKAIESLYANTNINDFDLIILDNGSDLKTVETLKTIKFPNCKIIYEKENLGVAGGINKILEYRSPGQHFMKLDNDIIFKEGTDKNWIKKVFDLFDFTLVTKDGERKTGAISIKPYTWSENEQKEINLLPEYDIVDEKDGLQYNPEGITGCSTIYNKEVLNELKSFNSYGLYGYEDSMICTRMYLMGYLPLYSTKIARVYHIDPGGDTDYIKWKHKQAADNWDRYLENYNEYTEKNKNVNEI